MNAIKELTINSRRRAQRAGDLAREIHEPLLALSAEIRALAEKYDHAGESVQGILQQVGRMQSILNSYLVSDPNIRSPRLKAVDLGAIVNECMLLLAASSHEGTKLLLEQPPALLPVFADESQLSQVLCILAVNAIKSSSESGNAAISTGRVRTEGERRSIFVEITTDGETQPWLVPFGDEHPDLSAVKRIVDLHGGDFSFESPRADIARGLRFRIVLPELVEFHI